MDFYQWGFTVSLIVLVFVLIIFLFLLFRWKISFEGKQYSLIPSEFTNKNSSALIKLEKKVARLSKNMKATSADSIEKQSGIAKNLLLESEKLDQRMQSLLSAFRDLREEYKILNTEIGVKAKELERYKKGYDSQITRRSLVPIARMHIEITKELEAGDIPSKQAAMLEVLQEECLDILENEGVELLWPKVGDRFSEYRNIKLPPLTKPAPDIESVGCIASVIRPAYQLTDAEISKVLVPASVEVFKEIETKGNDDHQSGPEEL